jgi:hypothetical protein
VLEAEPICAGGSVGEIATLLNGRLLYNELLSGSGTNLRGIAVDDHL